MKKLMILAISLITLSCFANNNQKVKLIIDAAHGGKDAGAVSTTGDKESEICMQFAKTLYDYAKSKNIEVVLTRNSNDETVSLENRIKFNTEDGVNTYFISFHLNSSDNPGMRGSNIMYSSLNSHADASKALAEKIMTAMNMLDALGSTMTDNKGVMVLKNSPAPAIGIQLGYISNTSDVVRLKDEGLQKELAMFIVKAVTE